MPRSPVCVDANIVVALVTAEAFSQRALALWTSWMTGENEPIAPWLLQFEVTSVMRRKVVRGSMQLEDAARSLREALALDIALIDRPGLSELAFEIADRLQQPATYDAHYLALAELLDCEFWTADERLYNAIRAQFPKVRWLGHFATDALTP
jgi:predicted nucleic acid-binding protein